MGGHLGSFIRLTVIRVVIIWEALGFLLARHSDIKQYQARLPTIRITHCIPLPRRFRVTRCVILVEGRTQEWHRRVRLIIGNFTSMYFTSMFSLSLAGFLAEVPECCMHR